VVEKDGLKYAPMEATVVSTSNNTGMLGGNVYLPERSLHIVGAQQPGRRLRKSGNRGQLHLNRSTQRFGQGLGRVLEPERLPWSSVHLLGDRIELPLRIVR